MSDTDRALQLYLDDHRAGAAAGLAVARRLADRYGDEHGYTDLRRLAAEIEADRDQLRAIRDHLGVESGGWKRSVALIGERLRRLKHLAPVGGRPTPSLVEELEELAAGVYAKQRLWASVASARIPTPAGIDPAELTGRAADQLATLERLHRQAASDAFGAAPGSSA